MADAAPATPASPSEAIEHAVLTPASTATAEGTQERPRAPLVVVEGIEVIFRTRRGLFGSEAVRAVDKVDLAVGRGETVALVGESGSGKTTLGRVTLRLVRPDAGRVRFDGRDITDEPEERLGWLRRRAQMVFQDPFSTLNPYMRVGELVEEPLLIAGVRSRSERRDRALRALEAVELVPAARVAAKYPTTMSGGQRQRVGIARALVRDPEYIVADEPVSMIDASSRIEILDVLRNLQLTRHVAFLYITHDIASARHFADRIAVMYRGAIVELGPAAATVDHPVHPYTQALIAAVPEPDPRNRLRRRAVHQRTGGDAVRIHPACPHGDPPRGAPLLLERPEDPDHVVACHGAGGFAG